MLHVEAMAALTLTSAVMSAAYECASCCIACCRAHAALEESLISEELERLLSGHIQACNANCIDAMPTPVLTHIACCRAHAALEESLIAEELERLLSDYVEARVKDVLASEHVQASLATRLAVSAFHQCQVFIKFSFVLSIKLFLKLYM
jgi:hypothetical protein